MVSCRLLTYRHSGKFDSVSKMVTSRIALEDVVHKGFEELCFEQGRPHQNSCYAQAKQRPRTLDRRGLVCNEEIKGGWPAPSGSSSSQVRQTLTNATGAA
jgi:hypothetical protein